MAQPPGQRARILNTFFAAEHGFEPENYNVGIILYKRRNGQNVVERIVVKHAEAPADTGEYYDRNSEISDEEKVLRRLWGAEHVIRLLAVVDNRHHQSRKWDEPLSRPFHYLSSILPWKLRDEQAIYPRAARFHFIVMEYLSRGDGNALIHRCQAMGVMEISEPLLWYFFLCLTRACVAMAWPPNHGSRNPPPVVREEIPNPMQGASRIVHGDLHLGNIMFGEYDAVDDIQPACHQGVPVLKMIDFGLAWDEWTPKDAQQDNIRYVGECIHQIALVGVDALVHDDRYRPAFLVDDIPSLGDFETYLEEDFYRSERFSKPFRQLLAWCMAVEQGRRPSVRRALRICEHNVRRAPNWRHLADEISEIYDMVPMDTDDGSDSEYEPASSNSGDSG
ncbi:hypothetical protein GGR58DRAFT_470068 [Xylaria digitata]|nr:hypothetical protein GGR58DRAFT_470068 [Xylaria digitata]